METTTSTWDSTHSIENSDCVASPSQYSVLWSNGFSNKEAYAKNQKYLRMVLKNINNHIPIKVTKNNENVTEVIIDPQDAFVVQLNTLIAEFDTSPRPEIVAVTIESLFNRKCVHTFSTKIAENPTKDGPFIRWTQIAKIPFSMGSSGKTFNKGDVAEGIIGAALAAKFSLEANADTEITPDDIKSILADMQPQMEAAETPPNITWNKKSHSNQELCSLEIILKKPQLLALLNASNWKGLSQEFTAAAKYANSNFVKAHLKSLVNTPNRDAVHIKSIGADNEKGTKVDLQVFIGREGVNLLKSNINISLKTGTTKTLEQAGITEDAIVELFARIGIKNTFDQEFDKNEIWYKNAFKFAAAQLNTQLTHNGDRDELRLIRKLGVSIENYATKKEKNVVKILLKSGDYKVFDYSGLSKKLMLANLNVIKLKARFVNKNTRPAFEIYDAVSNKRLIVFRLEIKEGGTQINKVHIEGGPLLDKLTVKPRTIR